MRLLTLKTVVAAIDVDASSRAALESARALATSAGAALHVVHAPHAPDAPAALQTMLEQANILPNEVTVHLEPGDPADVIGRLGDKLGADAFVLGPHRQRAETANSSPLGGTAMAVVTTAAVPCLVAKRTLRPPLQRVVVAVDMSDAARGALVVALSWASALRPTRAAGGAPTKLTTLHLRRSAESRPATLEAELARIRGDAGTWAGVSVEMVWAEGQSIATGIATYANDHDAGLVVLGTRGLGVDRVGRLGSVSAAVVQRSDAAVLLVPPAVWMTYAPSS